MISLLLLAAGIGAVVAILVLKWSDIINWFEDFFESPKYIDNLTDDEEDIIAVAVDDGIKNGKVSTIQCGFNKKRKKVIDGRRIESNNRDDDVTEKFNGNKVIIIE